MPAAVDPNYQRTKQITTPRRSPLNHNAPRVFQGLLVEGAAATRRRHVEHAARDGHAVPLVRVLGHQGVDGGQHALQCQVGLREQL